MKLGNPLEYIWEGAYLILVAVVLAYSWIGYRLDVLSPLPLTLPMTMILAPLCGALVYVFIRGIRRAFFASIIMCFTACLIVMLFILRPSYMGIGDFQYSLAEALRITVVMALYVFPFSAGGCLAMGYVYPE